MAKKNVWQVVPAVLTLALVACEESLTGVVDPMVESEAVTSVAAAHQPAAPSDFIAWWPGELDFLDIGDRAYHIVRHQGVTTTDGGVVGQAYLFTGDAFGPKDSGQFLEINNNIDFEPTEFTIDLWALGLGDGQNASESILIEKAISNGEFGFRGNGPGLSYLIAWRGTGASRHIEADVAFSKTPITDLPARLVSGPVADGEWVHVALTVAADRTATLYVNGEAVDYFQVETGTPQYGNGSIVIGNTWMWVRDSDAEGFGGTTFNGCIDEVRIFGRAMLALEIKHIYGSGVAGKCPPEEADPPPQNNNVPVVALIAGDEINEGDVFTSAGSLSDPDDDTWTVTVDYGDSSPVENLTLDGKSFELSHQYADNGTYEVTVTVDDEMAEPVSATASVVVNNVAPTVELGPDADATIFEGGTFETPGYFTDPGVVDSWTATVDYGDDPGADPVPLILLEDKSFVLSHVYAGNGSGPFTVTVTVDDGDDSGVDEALVAVVYPLTITKATVKMARWKRWRRRGRDSYEVEGRLPLSLLQRFDPDYDDLTVTFAGVEQVIRAGSFDRKHHRLRFKASRRAAGVQRIELRDNGRFKIQARGPFDSDLRPAPFGEPTEFYL